MDDMIADYKHRGEDSLVGIFILRKRYEVIVFCVNKKKISGRTSWAQNYPLLTDSFDTPVILRRRARLASLLRADRLNPPTRVEDLALVDFFR